jgi:glycosyltransferase involved in cell wall biosynthesis
MRVILASTFVPFVGGGSRTIVDWTAEAMRERGHDVEVLLVPFYEDVDDLLAQMIGLRRLPVADAGDRLVTIRWPSQLLEHPNKATWFIHHFRPLFDLWDSPFRVLPDSPRWRALRRLLNDADDRMLRECRDVFANSRVVADRLWRFNGVSAEVVQPPLGGDLSRFRTGGYGDFVFYPSRVVPIKRQLLAVRAMVHVTSDVRLVIAGQPEHADYADLLRDAVREHGLQDRVELQLEWIPEEVKTRLLADCLAVLYLPVDEDSYGYPTLEASHSRKAVVSVTDSGGVPEFVVNGVNGMVTEPTPSALAESIDRLRLEPGLAESMGQAAWERRSQLGISWDVVVPRLLGVA